MILLQLSVLLLKLWRIEPLNKAVKKEWTFILLVLSTLAALYFIWVKYDEILKNVTVEND